MARARIATSAAGVVVLALGACGGGGGGDNQSPPAGAERTPERADAAAAAYRDALREYAQRVQRTPIRLRDGRAPALPAPPRLPAGEGDDATRALAERVRVVHREMTLVNRSASRSTVRLTVAASDVNDDLYLRDLKLSTAAFARGGQLIRAQFRAGIRDGSAAGVPYDRRINLTYSRYLGELAAQLRRADRRVERLDAGDDLQRSALAFQRSGYAAWLGRIERSRSRIRAAPSVAASDVGYRDAAGSELYNNATTAAGSERPALMRGFKRTVARLADADGQATLPSAADPYRHVIVRGLARPREAESGVRPAVLARLWMLYRVRELDRVDAVRYDAAVQTLLLYDGGNPNTAIQPFLTGLEYLRGELNLPSREADRRSVRTILDFMRDATRVPVAPLQTGARAAVLAEVARLDPAALARGYPGDRVRRTKPLERAIRRMARRADDPVALRRALTDAVAATASRP